MRKLFMISLLCILCGAAQAQKIKIKTGIEVLKEQNFKCLEGKRVGLITNPTGVDNQMKSTIDMGSLVSGSGTNGVLPFNIQDPIAFRGDRCLRYVPLEKQRFKSGLRKNLRLIR